MTASEEQLRQWNSMIERVAKCDERVKELERELESAEWWSRHRQRLLVRRNNTIAKLKSEISQLTNGGGK